MFIGLYTQVFPMSSQNSFSFKSKVAYLFSLWKRTPLNNSNRPKLFVDAEKEALTDDLLNVSKKIGQNEAVLGRYSLGFMFQGGIASNMGMFAYIMLAFMPCFVFVLISKGWILYVLPTFYYSSKLNNFLAILSMASLFLMAFNILVDTHLTVTNKSIILTRRFFKLIKIWSKKYPLTNVSICGNIYNYQCLLTVNRDNYDKKLILKIKLHFFNMCHSSLDIVIRMQYALLLSHWFQALELSNNIKWYIEPIDYIVFGKTERSPELWARHSFTPNGFYDFYEVLKDVPEDMLLKAEGEPKKSKPQVSNIYLIIDYLKYTLNKGDYKSNDFYGQLLDRGERLICALDLTEVGSRPVGKLMVTDKRLNILTKEFKLNRAFDLKNTNLEIAISRNWSSSGWSHCALLYPGLRPYFIQLESSNAPVIELFKFLGVKTTQQ